MNVEDSMSWNPLHEEPSLIYSVVGDCGGGVSVR